MITVSQHSHMSKVDGKLTESKDIGAGVAVLATSGKRYTADKDNYYIVVNRKMRRRCTADTTYNTVSLAGQNSRCRRLHHHTKSGRLRCEQTIAHVDGT